MPEPPAYRKAAAFSGVRTRKHCRKIYQKQAVGCVAVAWRPQRTPAFRRLATNLFLRFFGASQFCRPVRQNQSFLALTLLSRAAAVLTAGKGGIAVTRYGKRYFWFAAGILINAFGVAAVTRAELGTPPIAGGGRMCSARGSR